MYNLKRIMISKKTTIALFITALIIGASLYFLSLGGNDQIIPQP